MTDSTASQILLANIPGHGIFTMNGNVVELIEMFGGLPHCYLGSAGCPKQGALLLADRAKETPPLLAPRPRMAQG